MAKRKALSLTPKEHAKLSKIAKSRTSQMVEVRRAKIMLLYHSNKRISEIANEIKTNRPLIERVIDKALTFGPLQALKDLPRPGRPLIITDEAKAWVLSIACQKPTNFGYAHEIWTYSLLIQYLRKHCKEYGYPCLAQLGKGRLNAILSKGNIKPHKVSYYLERRDPNFDEKMANVLCVYKEVEIQNALKDDRTSVTVSYDEKPGIQAIKNIATDLLPIPQKRATMSRDYEYKRLGTVSLLAAIDLHTGQIIPLVRNRHRSREVIEFLNKLDEYYPKDWDIRLVLDNHSSHISKETQAYLRTKPGRFKFVFTPKHGSWLNIIETFFSKIARSFLRRIRVESKQELIERIYRGIELINQEPVVFRWSYKMNEISIA